MYYKNGIARGVNYHINRGARGVPFMDNTPAYFIKVIGILNGVTV